MKNKDIDLIINEKLEEKYHMNEKLSSVKTKLVFNESFNKNTNSFFIRKKSLITYCSIAFSLILCLIATNVITFSMYSNIQHSTDFSENEYIELANDKIVSFCDSYTKLPIVTYNLDDEFILYIYKGIEKNNEKNLYFYHFCSFIQNKYLVTIEFYNDINQTLKIEDIKDKDFGLITSDSFDTSNHLSFNYYNINEFIYSRNIF